MTDFWRDWWISVEPLCMQFSRMLECLHQPRLRISDTGSWIQNNWTWSACVNVSYVSDSMTSERDNLNIIL